MSIYCSVQNRINSFISNLTTRELKQTIVLLTARVCTIGLGVIVSVLNTHILQPKQFGQFVFITNITNTLQLVFSPGVFLTGSRAVAASTLSVGRKKKLIGGLVIILCLVSVMHTGLVYAWSFVNDFFFHNQLSSTLRLVSLFVFIYPAQALINNLLQGLNSISLLAAFMVIPYLLYATCLSVAHFLFKVDLSLFNVLLFNYASFALTIAFIFIYLKPDFSKGLRSTLLLFRINRDFGSYLFYSTILVSGVTYLVNYIIAFVAGTTEFGYYALAFTLAYPMSLLPATFGVVLFKKAVSEGAYTRQQQITTISVSVLIFILYMLLLDPVFTILYPSSFQKTKTLVIFLALASLMQGLGEFYNKFAIAKGKGKEIFYSSILTGAIFLSLVAALLPLWGIEGVLISQLASSALYLSTMYFLFQKENKK
jgi:O-antigen/teichoic acid export membrane protein